MPLINPTPEEGAEAMSDAVNREMLRRDLEKVFLDHEAYVRTLNNLALADIVGDATSGIPLEDEKSGPAE